MKFLMRLLVFSFFVLFFDSCSNVNSNVLFKIPKGENFQYDSLPLKPSQDYIIGPGDRFNFLFSTNKGEKLITGVSGVKGVEGQSFLQTNISVIQDYLVRTDGTAELPVIGSIKVQGMTVIKLKDTLTQILSKDYIDPFVQIRLTNQRVIVFNGRGNAQVITLNNLNTSLLETIALSGGLSAEARANSIKLIRKVKNKREVYKIDLSTIHGMKQAEMIVQSNDYIYVDFKPRLASSFMAEISPWLSLFTSTLVLFTFLRN
jgi:polysaccharide export outer membrane protein